MRAFKRDVENSSAKLLYVAIIVIFVVICSVYVLVWNEVKKQVINVLNTDNAHYEFGYDKISVSGFPIILKTKVKNLEVKFLYKNRNVSFIFDELSIRNFIFTKNVNILFNGNIIIKNSIDGDEIYNKIIIGEHDIRFSLDGNNLINSIDAFFKNMEIQNIVKEQSVLSNKLVNASLKLITIIDQEYQNRTFRLNIDSINTDVGSDKKLESNFEVIFSNIKEYEYDKLVKIRNVIDTFVFNDISNNYSINISGDHISDSYVKSAKINLDASILNYDYLVSAINKDADFLVSKDTVYKLIQILELVPKNSKDTQSEKYYSIKSDTKSRRFFINDVDVNDIIRKLIFKNDID